MRSNLVLVLDRPFLDLKCPNVGEFAGPGYARDPALVRGGCFGIVAVPDGRAARQQGHRLRGTAVVLQRAQQGVEYRHERNQRSIDGLPTHLFDDQPG